MSHRLVAECFEFLMWKELVRHLQLLKPDNVGLALLQPEQDVFESGAKAVHIPGRNAQDGSLSWR